MSSKTYIACQASMAQHLRNSFDGMEVEVDNNLTVPYEFRQRELTLDEILEEQVAKEERQDADPKSAVTVIVPLVTEIDDPWNTAYLAVRVSKDHTVWDVANVCKSVEPDVSLIDGVNVPATIGALKAALKKAQINVLSISEAQGLIKLGA